MCNLEMLYSIHIIMYDDMIRVLPSTSNGIKSPPEKKQLIHNKHAHTHSSTQFSLAHSQ